MLHTNGLRGSTVVPQPRGLLDIGEAQRKLSAKPLKRAGYEAPALQQLNRVKSDRGE